MLASFGITDRNTSNPPLGSYTSSLCQKSGPRGVPAMQDNIDRQMRVTCWISSLARRFERVGKEALLVLGGCYACCGCCESYTAR